MINFETMTVVQMKKYLSPKVLQKLSTPELGRLLSAARSVRDFFAQKGGLDASLEAAYWNVAEKEIVKEFKNRNYNVYITNFNDVFSALNSLLAEKYKTATEALEQITSSYEPGVLIQIKQELLNDPDHLSKFGAVIDFFDKKIKSVLS